MGLLILAARQRMKKTVPGPRIAPVQRRIRHRSQRHVEIKRRAQQPEPRQYGHRENECPIFFRPHQEPTRRQHRDQTDQIVNHEYRQVPVEQRGFSDRCAEQRENVKRHQTQDNVLPFRPRIGDAFVPGRQRRDHKGSQRPETGQMREGQAGGATFADVNSTGLDQDQEYQIPCSDAHQNVASKRRPVLGSLHGFRCQPDPGFDRENPDDDEDHEERAVVFESGQFAVGFQDHADQENDAVAQEQIPSQLGLRRRDGDLDTHCRDDQSLVVGETDSEQKQRPVEVALLVRRINPAQQTTEHAYKREQAEWINLDDDGLAPHESVESDQHPRHVAGQHAQRVFPAPVDTFELLDPFEDHAAAARGD